MDSRFAALADRYSQIEVEPEQPEVDNYSKPSNCLADIWNISETYGITFHFDNLITGEHDYNWSKDYEKADSTVFFVEKNLIKEYIDSQHADEGDIKIKQTIQNTALSGDTCW